ncbi:N5-carboxyaminoimidazole ribonucleotide mutase [bacterium BMS3Bbin06]|nr:N5-carboxyaminoimidazole ribonucleotide mutase [bacterium BMS3Abin08]GBE35662.1 N5-carboxyaminoimidazole ribonucleotide mutase [bacterium BMS3Bbin06]
MGRVVIIMGSKADLEWSEMIEGVLKELGVEVIKRVSSAHKTPLRCIEIIREYEGEGVVFIAVAGRSNALGGFVDAQTDCPVITCPPYSDSFGGTDIYSSLRMPSSVAPLVILEPEGAAIAAAKILGIREESLKQGVAEYQRASKERIERDDREVSGG